MTVLDPKPRKKAVLVVEDDEKTRRLIARALEGRYVVREAANGHDAMEILKTPGQVDMMICDVMMPGMDGIELTKALKADKAVKSIPVIILSARNAPQDLVKGISAGARHYMTKPFSVKELMERVARAIGD